MRTLLPGEGNYIPFTLAVMLATIFGGLRSGLAASLLGACIAGGLSAASGAEWRIELIQFCLVCLVIVAAATRVERLRTQARRSEHEAHARTHELAVLSDELSLLIDGAESYAIYMLDPGGHVALWNRGAERLKGWSEAEVVGRHTAIFYPQAAVDQGKPARDLERARAEGQVVEEDWRLRKNGSEFLAHVTITALRDERGTLRGFGKVIRDITAERAAERKLIASAEQFRSVLATVPNGMVVIDESGAIRSFSATAQRMFGYPEAAVLGRNISLLMPSPDRERHDAYLERYRSTGEQRIIGRPRLVSGQRSDGTIFPLELSVGEAPSVSGRVFTGFMQDMTEKFATEEQVETLRQELFHAGRLSAMGTMASTLAHEINQPITAIAAFVRGARNLVRGGDAQDRADIEEALELAHAEAMRAGGIVRRLREFVARGDMEKTVEDLPALIQEAAKLGTIGAREKGVGTRLLLDSAAGPVLVDRVQIQQVLVNLMRNAIEALSQSDVRELTVSTSGGEPGYVRVSVADTGPGLPPQIAADLFRAFNTTKADGMGLGLSICRTIVEANGGRIWAEPREGGGTVFHFTAPRADGEVTHDGQTADPPGGR